MSSTTARAPARACPICLETSARTLHRQPFVLPDGHPLGVGYDVVCCTACGFVYADTVVSQDEYDGYYTQLSKYDDAHTATGAGAQSWDDDRLADMAKMLAGYLPDRNARIVDVGCAGGGLLRHLAALGYLRLVGVDPSPRCAAAADAIPGVTGRVGTLFSLPAEADDADAVILSHVLEHLQDVHRGLANARKLLAPGGLIYVEVPDATRYAEHLVAPFQDFNIEHVNHFGSISLAALLVRGGFEVLATARRRIEAAAGVPYPAVYAVGRAQERGASTVPERDADLEPAIRDYVRRSDALMRRVDKGFGALIRRGLPILVWGVGQLTFKLLIMTRLGNVPIRAFVDTNPAYHGRRLRGAPILPPEAVERFSEPILIGTILHADAIEARLREMGAANQVIRLSTE